MAVANRSSRLGRARSTVALEVTTVPRVKAVARVLARAREQAQAEFASRHPRRGSNHGRAIKVRLYDRGTSTRRQRARLSLRDREAVLAAALPPAFVDGRPNVRLVHMELIFYGDGCGGHWHVDPTAEGDEIVIATLQGCAWFELREGKTPIDATRTRPGTLLRLAGAARRPCEHRAGPAEGGVRVALQLGFSS